jgi:hypothetical protein
MLAAASTVRQVTDLVAQLAGLLVLAGTVAGLAAFLYQWYVREAIPRGLSLLIGLAGVTVYLNTSRALGQVIGGSTLPTETEVALFNITAFAFATAGAVLGRRAGARFGANIALGRGVDGVETEVGRLVQSVGRVISVQLPDEIDDVVGYDPVPAETKESLAGKTFLFPRKLTVAELRSRLVSRLKTDYAVGHVDVELADDGRVEYLALGSRAAGIGPTLPPATNAVALRADPAFSASAGDLVQVWETDPMRRVLTGELRGVAGNIVTVAIDTGDTPKVDPRKEYRLVTLPVDDRPDREFASLLRAADETLSSVTVEAGSLLHGLPVGALALAVVATRPDGDQPVALPGPRYLLAPGDTVFAIARPETLRRLERAGKPSDPTSPPGAGPVREPEPGAPTSRERGVPAPEETTAATGETDARSPVTDEPGPTADGASTGGDGPDDHQGQPDTAVDAGTGEDTEAGTGVDASSFEQLEAALDSGEAGWGADDGGSGSEPREPTDAGEPDGDDVPVDRQERPDAAVDDGTGLETDAGADVEFGGDDADDLSALEPDEPADGLDLEEDLDFGGGIDDTGESEDEDEDEDGDEDADGERTDNETDGDEGDEDGGTSDGAKSFQQLKEEFESGDADWEDDVTDSPGGDMRLDE